jgi:L-threonylcarbamoyladenylate synthase
MADILKSDRSSYNRAISLLIAGEPVALPTETVYGLAARASDDEAVVNIFKIKARPHSKRFSVVVGSIIAAGKIAKLSPLAKQLAEAFWPGPLTLVLPLQKYASISPLALAGGETIGLRCPDIPWMAHFKKANFHDPLILPSANTSGRPAPISAKAVDQDIGGKIPLIVDGGICQTGIESTIIAVENGHGRVLRYGAIPPEALAPFPLDWSPK